MIYIIVKLLQKILEFKIWKANIEFLVDCKNYFYTNPALILKYNLKSN